MWCKYKAMQELSKLGYSISELCKYSEIARSSYYKWLNNSKTTKSKENSIIKAEIINIY
jgi:DNA invertase Pin-like site-specific DNA recombinase